jgi:hypothetical protein
MHSSTEYKPMRILVLGYVIKSPLGGLVWSHLQYMIGLKRLGHEVLFLEDSDDFPACYNPDTFLVDTDPAYGLRFIAEVFDAYDLKDQWAYYDAHSGNWYGQSRQAVFPSVQGADVVLNLGAVTPLREWWLGIPVRVLVDTDPAFTQVRHLTEPATHHVARQHTHFFSFAENINTPGCTIPPDGFPVAADAPALRHRRLETRSPAAFGKLDHRHAVEQLQSA